MVDVPHIRQCACNVDPLDLLRIRRWKVFMEPEEPKEGKQNTYAYAFAHLPPDQPPQTMVHHTGERLDRGWFGSK
jgi:hypothetical protein